MKPSDTLHSQPGALLGGWYEIADDLRSIARVLASADGHCHCAHTGKAFCSCCTSSSARLHDVCEACDRVLARLDSACTALADHSLRFTPALGDVTHADAATRQRLTRLCSLAEQLRHVLRVVEMRTEAGSGAHCPSSDLVRLLPVAKELDTLARALADTVTTEHRP